MAEMLVDSTKLDACMTAEANAIRAKTGGSTPIPYDYANNKGFADAIAAIETITGEDAQKHTWDQCPELVTAYLDEVTYDPTDYTTSRIAEFAPSTADRSNTKPVGAAVRTSAGTLYRKGYGIVSANGTTTVYNDVPGESTPFVVKSGNDVTEFGVLKPSGFLRWISCPSAINTRDLGGWSCDGGTVKYGMIFRGGEVSSSDRDVLVNQCHVMHDINLRGAGEATWSVSPLGADVRFHKWSRTASYHLSDRELIKDMLLTVFDAVNHGEPCYVHCWIGCDRTGTLVGLILGLLGVGQSDVDKEYELSSFAMGSGTDSDARRRNETDWVTLIGEINAYGGGTFRDKIVQFMLQIGIPLATLNAFRSNMIDGTPQVLSPVVQSFTVSNSLNGATSSNLATSATQYQSYAATIVPDDGKIISSASIKMDGVDITSLVFTGTETLPVAKVSYALTGCEATTMKHSAILGQMFYAVFSAQWEYGYDISNATRTITMGGVDVSSYFSNGTILIPNVTGDISITIETVQSEPPNLFDYADASLASRISSNGSVVEASGNVLVTELIPMKMNDYVYVQTDVVQNGSYQPMVSYYRSDGTWIASHWPNHMTKSTDNKSFYKKMDYDAAFFRVGIAYGSLDNIIIQRRLTAPTLT